jgi:predicted RNA binding protein YcfA (HicA-like mRNA interferase family)
MSEIDQISWREFEKFLLSYGCVFKRQKGDHRIYNKTGILRPLVVPQKRVLPVFIILNNLRVLGISKEEFLKIIKDL